MVIFYQFEIWKLAIVLAVIRAKVKRTWIKTTIYDALLIRMHIIEVQRFLRIVLFLSLHHCGPFGRPCKDGKMPMRERGDMEVSHIRARMGGNATQSINRRCWCWTMHGKGQELLVHDYTNIVYRLRYLFTLLSPSPKWSWLLKQMYAFF